MRFRRVIALVAVVLAANCTGPPPQNGPNVVPNNQDTNNATNDDATNNAGTENSTNGQTENDETNNDQTNNVEDGPNCDDCTPGDMRCHETDAGTVYFQVCASDIDGDGGDCTNWRTEEACLAAQTCDDTNGCICPTTCNLSGEISCEPDGAFLCMMIDGCPRSVNIARDDESCPSPAGVDGIIDCEADFDNGYCQDGCADGRACVEVCAGRFHCQSER